MKKVTSCHYLQKYNEINNITKVLKYCNKLVLQVLDNEKTV